MRWLVAGLLLVACRDTEPGRIVAAMPEYDFGAVELGQSKTVAIELRNAGDEAVTLVAVEADGLDFSIASTTCGEQLAASMRCTVNLAFTPTSAGSVHGGVFVDTGDEGMIISATAKGVTPP